MRITLLGVSYRGFEIGYITGPPGYRGAWRSSLTAPSSQKIKRKSSVWREGFLYVDTKEELVEVVKQCIDLQYAKETEEVFLGREMTMEEHCEWLDSRRRKEG